MNSHPYTRRLEVVNLMPTFSRFELSCGCGRTLEGFRMSLEGFWQGFPVACKVCGRQHVLEGPAVRFDNGAARPVTSV
jgi:hypothetical protein